MEIRTDKNRAITRIAPTGRRRAGGMRWLRLWRNGIRLSVDGEKAPGRIGRGDPPEFKSRVRSGAPPWRRSSGTSCTGGRITTFEAYVREHIRFLGCARPTVLWAGGSPVEEVREILDAEFASGKTVQEATPWAALIADGFLNELCTFSSAGKRSLRSGP